LSIAEDLLGDDRIDFRELLAEETQLTQTAVHETGRREIIGLDVGEAETEAFWTEFLRSLVARGLVGVQLGISDAHLGLKTTIARVLGGPWQRCTVHYADAVVMPTRVTGPANRWVVCG
jgi:transposase-like protein